MAHSLAFLTADGELIREFGPKPAGFDKLGDDEKAMAPGPWLPTEAGAHRFVWDLRHAGAVRVLGDKTTGSAAAGPLVVPGKYLARLTVGEAVLETAFEVVNDPRVTRPRPIWKPSWSC
ncbi:MAG: hypothetical protein HC802_21695 [Caldilineaceae bacterium]|nr:hypothetical protein [Caldilineaceae bacterium]